MEDLAGVAPGHKKRDGHTRAHYEKQKRQSFSYFRVSVEDLKKMQDFQFNVFDFINATFALSHTKKQLTIQILESLKERPMSFIELHQKLNARKGTLYLLCLALEKSGFIEKKLGKGEPYYLSNSFPELLKNYSEWWQRWKGN